MKSMYLGAALVIGALVSTPVIAADTIRVVSTHKGFWDTTLIEYGKEKGIFSDDGLDIDLAFTQSGGGDSLQTVIAGGADVGVGVGVAAALAAVTQGAPIVIVGSEFIGASDIFYYAKGESDIHSFKDLDGRMLGISAQGSTTATIAALLASSENVSVDLVPTGGPPTTIAQVMTDQVDAGWAVYPIGMDRVANGELRIIASGNDAPGMAEETARVVVASSDYAARNEELLKRFFVSYSKVLDWAYSTDEALQKYADNHGIALEAARDIVERGYPREAMEWGRMGALDITMDAAVANRVLNRPLTDEEVADAFNLVRTLHR